MTFFIATTLVDVMRGTGTDEFGDVTDLSAVVEFGLPAAVTEGTQRRYRPTEERGDVVEQYTIRMRPGVDVREGDRLVSQRDRAVYLVQGVTRSHSIVGAADVRVTAIRAGFQSMQADI